MANSSVRLLHVVPKSFLSEQHRYLGSTKDIAGRVQYFQDRDLRSDLLAHDKTVETVLSVLGSADLSAYTHVLIEKANYGAVFRHLRRKAPGAKIIFRAHNAETLHRVDYVRACLAPPRTRSVAEVVQNISNVLRYGGRDLSVVWHTDHVLSISQWDTEHYWRYLAPKTRTTTAPFFSATPVCQRNADRSPEEATGHCDRLIPARSSNRGWSQSFFRASEENGGGTLRECWLAIRCQWCAN